MNLNPIVSLFHKILKYDVI